MALFWLLCLSLVALTVALLIAPFLRRKAPGGMVTPALIALGAPVAAVALYLLVGTPEALDYRPPAEAPAQQQHMEQATDALARRLQQEPDNLEGWLLLGRARVSLGQPGRAVAAFEQARRLAPNNAAVLVHLAQAMGYANDYNLTGEPAVLLTQAAQLAPQDEKALWYAGIAEYQGGDFAAAAAYWQRLLPLLEPGSEVARTVAQQLEDAQGRAAVQSEAGSLTAPSRQPAPVTRASQSQVAIRVSVSLAPELAPAVAPDDALFVFARAASGPPMPLAVERHRASELPLTLVLDETDSMTGARTLADAGEFVVVARVSKSGTAIGQAGDLEGRSPPLRLPQPGVVEIVIDSPWVP